MNVIVKSVSNKFVLVECKYGQFTVEWNGNNPKVKKQYEIELDIGQEIEVEKLKKLDNYKIQNLRNGKIEINGEVEDEDEDGVAYFRFANDLLMIDIGENGYSGLKIKIIASKIVAYPL